MMSECSSPADDYPSTLTTTVTNKTTDTSDRSVTKPDTDVTKSPLGNCCKENDILMKKSLTSVRHNYVIIDGKRIRSALAGRRRRDDRRVSFPDDKDLVTGYLEPANPWVHAEDLTRDILLSSYKESCQRHCAEPLKKVLDQLENLEIRNGRCEDFSLKEGILEKKDCEPLEEVFKRLQFRKIDLEKSGLTDESAETIFDMIEYYESAKHVDISSNGNIGTRGWQACGQMIKKTLCLEQLDAKGIVLTQQHMNILRRPLQLVSHLQILKVENCHLAGRAFVILVAALKLNTGLKELYLADNNLTEDDAIQLGALLRVNNCLQLLDVSNNDIKDQGVHNILDGLVHQSRDEGSRGLKILILWNNHLSKICSGDFANIIAQSKSLETLNIGHNGLSDDFLDICKDALKHNTVLLQLGVQATGLMNKGIMALAEVVGKNESLQRIDLRDNHIQLTGLTFLCLAMKKNVNITQIDLDDKTWSKAPSMMETYLSIVSEIRSYCARNDEPISTDSSTEESGSPQHRSRLSSVNSRKISLTCQTLPRSPSAPQGAGDPTNRTTMLEPKRTTGGRLRSPAPSPIPSPVASPIPSPSRSRFVVSRVSEASLSSTNSSASSSPITPPSLASPPCFFPPTSGTSRFRVTVVEGSIPPVKNIVTASTNITIGFNYRVEMPDRVDSDDSDSVFRSSSDDSRLGSSSSADSLDDRLPTPDSGAVLDVDRTITTLLPATPEIQQSEDKSPAVDDTESNVNKTLTLEPRPEEPKILDVPKQSSLERLLGLFQNPGNLFAAFPDKPEVPVRHIQDSMMALGDRFHQYLRDRQPLQRSISDTSKSSTASKSDPVKSLSVDQLLAIDNDTSDNQDADRRLSGVIEDDELDCQQNIDKKVVDRGDDTSVPVTYKSEYSIMIGECGGIDGDTITCDNGTEDSINSCRLRNSTVLIIGGEEIDVHKLECGADDIRDLGDDCCVGESDAQGNQVGNTGDDKCGDDEGEEGEKIECLEEDVRDVLAFIIESVSASENFIDFDEPVDDFGSGVNYQERERQDNIVLKVSSVQSIGEGCGVEDNQASRSPTNLLIDKSRNVHRNSQDSGIEEANVSISDDNLENPQARDSFQESLDSGIDSECSSVCIRTDTVPFKDQDDKFYDIPEVDQGIGGTILIKASVFVDNGGSGIGEDVGRGEIGGDLMVIGKIKCEEQISNSTSVE